MLRVGLRYGEEVLRIDENASLLHNPVGSLCPRLLHVPEEVSLKALLDGIDCLCFFFGVEFAILIFVKVLGKEVVTIANMTIAIEIKSDIGTLLSPPTRLQLSVGFVSLIISLIPVSGDFNLCLKCVSIVPPNLGLVLFVETKLINLWNLMHDLIMLDVTHNFI